MRSHFRTTGYFGRKAVLLQKERCDVVFFRGHFLILQGLASWKKRCIASCYIVLNIALFYGNVVPGKTRLADYAGKKTKNIAFFRILPHRLHGWWDTLRHVLQACCGFSTVVWKEFWPSFEKVSENCTLNIARFARRRVEHLSRGTITMYAQPHNKNITTFPLNNLNYPW